MEQEKPPDGETTQPVNDNGKNGGKPIDPRTLSIAEAIGRKFARDYIKRTRAANDNHAGGEDHP